MNKQGYCYSSTHPMRTIVSNFNHKKGQTWSNRDIVGQEFYTKNVSRCERSMKNRRRRRKEEERREVLNHILFNAYIQASE